MRFPLEAINAMSGNFFVNTLLLAAVAAALGFWWTGSRAKELAVGHARALCQREGVQLLDYTVALHKMSIARSASGNACLRRDYNFEFTAEGNYRDQGSVSLNGHSLVKVTLPYTRDADGNRVFVN